MISHRGYLAFAAAAAGLVLAGVTLNLLLLTGAFAIFAALAVEALGFHLPEPGPARYPFEILRQEAPTVLSPGGEAECALELRYGGKGPVRAELRELLPSSLPAVAGSATVRRRFWPGDTVRLACTLRAGARGSHVVGPLAITVESPHGLAWSQWMVPESDRPVRVVPPAPIERSYRIGPALFTRVQGRVALRHRGFGTEFRSLRPYQLSDDIRHVAWKRSRPGQLFVREFEQESRQDYVLLLDVTPSMLAGEPGTNALDRAVEAASLVVAAVARGGEDRVGLLTHTDRARQWLRPARGERHFRLLAENLAYLTTSEGRFSLPAALDLLGRRLPRTAHVLAFTALDGPGEGMHRSIARFRARGHHLYVFPPNLAGFYPPADPAEPAARALAWAEEDEHRRLAAQLSELRGEGVPVFPYDRRGASGQILSTYGQLRAWGMA